MPARRIIIFGWDSGVARRSSWHLAAWGNRTWFPLSIEIYYYGNFATAPGGTRTHALRFRKPPLDFRIANKINGFLASPIRL